MLTQISDAFGPSPSRDDLAQDLADAAARRLDKPLPAKPVAYADPGMDATLYLFEVYAWSLPWLEPAQLHRHAPTLMRLSLKNESADTEEYIYRSFQALGWLLSADNPPSIRAHLRSLWQPLTALQRACIAAYVCTNSSSSPDQEAWARVVAHDSSGRSGDWFDVLWPERERPDAADVIA